MNKRYLIILSVLITLVGCFFLFFDKPSNAELYNECYKKIEKQTVFASIDTNDDINVVVDYKVINEEYQYVVTITSNEKLNNFKTMLVDSEMDEEYYPSFGVFDNLNINLVTSSPAEKETKGINLVISSEEEIVSFKLYVSYNGNEYYYLLEV